MVYTLSEKESEELIYRIILDGEDKDNFTPEFQETVIGVIKRMRETR